MEDGAAGSTYEGEQQCAKLGKQDWLDWGLQGLEAAEQKQALTVFYELRRHTELHHG
jgi:hypothetical protein